MQRRENASRLLLNLYIQMNYTPAPPSLSMCTLHKTKEKHLFETNKCFSPENIPKNRNDSWPWGVNPRSRVISVHSWYLSSFVILSFFVCLLSTFSHQTTRFHRDFLKEILLFLCSCAKGEFLTTDKGFPAAFAYHRRVSRFTPRFFVSSPFGCARSIRFPFARWRLYGCRAFLSTDRRDASCGLEWKSCHWRVPRFWILGTEVVSPSACTFLSSPIFYQKIRPISIGKL